MKNMVYPAVRRSAATYTLHGKTIAEPYDYLEDPAAEETKAFVEGQNKLFESYMKDSDDLRKKIEERILATQNYARTGAPSLRGGKYYYNFNSGLQNQNIIRRTNTVNDLSQSEVFFDPNQLSADGTTALKGVGWSKSEEYYAYSVSDKGSDWQHIHVKKASTGEDLPDSIEWAKFTGIAWWGNAGFFYTRYPALAENTDKGAETDSAQDAFVCFHKLGTSQNEDIVVFKMPEFPLYSLAAEVSDCHKYIMISIFDGCEPFNMFWVSELPNNIEDLGSSLNFKKLINEFVGEYSYLGNDEQVFYFTSTRDAPKKKIISINIETEEVQEIVAEQESLLSYAALVKQTLMLIYLEDVKDVFYYRTLADSTLNKLNIPIGSIVSLFTDRAKSFVSFKISSFLLPGRSYYFDVEDPNNTLAVFADDTVEGFDAENFVTEQKFFPSADGTMIPMFMVHKKGLLSPSSPLLVYGYGGFNISLTPSFSASRLTFLNNLNGVLAIPNIRGGGEYGQAWHDAGRRANKQNCFTDFIETVKYLHKNNIGSPATTAIMGGSNGGLLVAACANQAPEELGAVVCQVGVLDMYKFHKFTIGHAWTSDYGNPDNGEDFNVLTKYSPLHNVKEGVKYPAIMVVTGDHDDRVVPLHSLKYIAELQHANPSLGGPFLGRIEVAAGHGAGKPTSKIIREAADMYTFIAKQIGATWHDE